MAEKTGLAVKKQPHTCPVDDFHLSIRLGIAQQNNSESLTKLVSRADKALYLAKTGGRNRAVQAKTA
ncbi:MAG: diguanylate cyclase [Magnetococcales bacterium]|nr:diguanylate cyclase [Magnetococcales bacterium]